MKFKKYILIFILLISSELYPNVDEEEVKEKLSLLMGQNTSGTDFWFAIPPPYLLELGKYNDELKILIVSPLKSEITVSIPGKGYYNEYSIVENKVFEVAMPIELAQLASYTGNVEDGLPAKVYKGAAINVTSTSPAVVYVIVNSINNSEGFLAIPTSSLGNQYINMVYQEPDVTAGLMAPFTGVIGVYENTEVEFVLGGGPNEYDEVLFDNGDIIRNGDTATQNINQGDVWLLSINGHAQDLSGSIFNSTKPFALISGIHCGVFPMNAYACNYAIEMELPVYTWGKYYYVSPIKQKTFNGVVRIFASEPDTKIYRNNELITTLSKGGGGKIGESYHEMRLWPKYDEFWQINPPKIATIHSNKPIGIMYYNSGNLEDTSHFSYDPFMMALIPAEQFSNSLYFTNPNSDAQNPNFNFNRINLIFELKEGKVPDDIFFANLSNEPIIWQKLTDIFNIDFEKFEIEYNGKEFGTKNILLPSASVFGLKSDVSKFASFSYGFSHYEPYGFPSGVNMKNNTVIDTVTPIVKINGGIDDKVIEGTLDDYTYISSGLSQFYLIGSLSSNYELKITSVDAGKELNSKKEILFTPGVTKKLNWQLSKINEEEIGNAVLFVSDRNGNDTLIFIGTLPTNIKDKENIKLLKITQSNIEVLPQALADGFTELLVFDINGNRLLNSDIANQRNIALSQLASGTYFATLKNGERLVTQKFVVVK